MAPQARPLRTYTEERDGKTYTVNVYPDHTPEQGREDIADVSLNERDGLMRDWQLAVRHDLTEAGIPLGKLGDDPLRNLVASEKLVLNEPAVPAVEELIDRWGDTPERRAFLEALSAGHQVAGACRLSGLRWEQARYLLRQLRKAA